jgi:hypothetical protein
MMTKSEFRDYHERVAARLRSLLPTATTAASRARLLEQAEKHARLAEAEGETPELEKAS